MKYRILKILSAFIYIILVAVLITLQSMQIQGTMTRLMANVITLALSFPIIVFLRYWLSDSAKEDNDSSEGEETQHNYDDTEAAFMSKMEAAGISKREYEVAWLIFRGYSNIGIAEELYISEGTVKKHASHIYEKLEITGRKELKDILKN